jgi:hypothetical protein
MGRGWGNRNPYCPKLSENFAKKVKIAHFEGRFLSPPPVSFFQKIKVDRRIHIPLFQIFLDLPLKKKRLFKDVLILLESHVLGYNFYEQMLNSSNVHCRDESLLADFSFFADMNAPNFAS